MYVKVSPSNEFHDLLQEHEVGGHDARWPSIRWDYLKFCLQLEKESLKIMRWYILYCLHTPDIM